MNSVTSSPYNPIHFTYANKQLDPKYNFKDVYDDLYQNRLIRSYVSLFYPQKWQKTDNIRLQFITEGIGNFEIHVYNSRGFVYDTIQSTIVVDPAVYSPQSLRQFDIPLTNYPTDCYKFQVFASGVILMDSEYQSIADRWPETLLYEYYHTSNKLNGYFSQFRPMLRVEGMLDEIEPDISFTNYKDEPGNSETLYGIETDKRLLYIGDIWGIPDWMAKKVSKILLLNQVKIEGVSWSLRSDSKLSAQKREGYPMNYYSVEIERAKNSNMAVTDAALPVAINLASINIDAQSVGIGTGVINIQIPN